MLNVAGNGNLKGKDDIEVAEPYPKLIAISGHVLNVSYISGWPLACSWKL